MKFNAAFVNAYKARRAAETAAESAPRRGTSVPASTDPSPDPPPGSTGSVRVMGVDTSLRCTGLAILDCRRGSSEPELVDMRPIPCPARLSIPECLVKISDTIEAYLDEFTPDEVAMEGIFFCKNARTALILGHARGVVVAACARRRLPIFEYPPSRVKRALAGTGSATKFQMQTMVQRMFGLEELPQEDSADAVAMAVTRLHERRFGGAEL